MFQIKWYIKDFLLSRWGLALMLLATVVDLAILGYLFWVVPNMPYPFISPLGITHWLLYTYILITANAIKSDGEIWMSTSRYAENFWSKSALVGAAIGSIAIWFMYSPIDLPIPTRILSGVLLGTIFATSVGCCIFAMRIKYHEL